MELAVQVRGSWEHALASARWAEDQDLAAFSMPDHYLHRGSSPELPAWDHLVHLAVLAHETETIELVSLVSPIAFRHPAVLYKMGVTIDEISGGRFTLGVGAGWMDEEFELFGIPYPDLKTRMDIFEEMMAYLRAAITPEAVGFDGTHYQLAEFDPRPHPKSLRLLAGGAGKPKARRIAAKYCDEYNLYARPPEVYAETRQATIELAVEHGRDPEDIYWSSASPGLAAKDPADYRRLLEQMSQLTGQSTEHIEAMFDKRGYPHGDGSKASEMLAALEEAGCQRFYVQAFLEEDRRSDFDIIFEALQG